MAESFTDRLVDRLGWLESLGELIQKIVGGIYGALGGPGKALKDLLHGTKPLGHPLHPALTDVPLGAWTAGVVADLVASFTHAVPTQAGDIALLVGTVGALGAALSGYTDHHETYGHERRMATLHGLVMTTVVVLEVVSLLLRWVGGFGVHGLAVALSLIALLVAFYGGYLGGHLTFGIGTMVNRHAFTEQPTEWFAAGMAADYQEGQMKLADAGGLPVLVVRRQGRIYAIANTCSHAGGPLNEGTLEGDVVTCPWHGSQFCVRNGLVRGGPATFPQPAFEVREQNGKVEVRTTELQHA